MCASSDDSDASNHFLDADSEEEEGEQQLTAPSSATPSLSIVSKNSGRKPTSDVYSFVKQDTDNQQSFYYCILCSAKNQEQRWKTRNTSNFRLHLTKEHSDVYNTGSNQSKITQFPAKSPRSLSKKKRDLHSGFTVSDKTHADNALTNWIVNHSQPFKVVEHPDFIKFCSALRDDYSVPTRNTIKNRIVDRWQKEKSRVRAKLTVHLGNGSRCGLTTDMWTSSAKRGYMVVTVHYIDGEWEMKSVIVGFVRVMYPHTGERLGNHLIDAIKEMNPLLLASIWAITTDNAANNGTICSTINRNLLTLINAINLQSVPANAASSNPEAVEIPFPHDVFLISCMAHTLQLTVKEGLKACKSLDLAIGRFRDCIKKLNDSPKLLEALAAVCSTLNIKYTIPQFDVQTRWNSTWTMLNGVIGIKPGLEELLRRIRCRHAGYCEFTIDPSSDLAAEIPRESWSAVQDFCKFLQPFKDATVFMSASEYPRW